VSECPANGHCFYSKILAPTVEWHLSVPGGNCDATCVSIGGECNPDYIFPGNEASVLTAALETGVACAKVADRCDMGETPLFLASSGTCAYCSNGNHPGHTEDARTATPVCQRRWGDRERFCPCSHVVDSTVSPSIAPTSGKRVEKCLVANSDDSNRPLCYVDSAYVDTCSNKGCNGCCGSQCSWVSTYCNEADGIVAACPSGYTQVGTLSDNNDIAGAGLGQSHENSIEECKNLCEDTPDCVAFMYGGYTAEGDSTLCELSAFVTPDNNWGSNFRFCRKTVKCLMVNPDNQNRPLCYVNDVHVDTCSNNGCKGCCGSQCSWISKYCPLPTDPTASPTSSIPTAIPSVSPSIAPRSVCDPYSQQECEAAARKLGLQLGGNGYDFAGDYGTKGCYAYISGTYAEMAFYGTGGSKSEMTTTLESPKFRLVNRDCDSFLEAQQGLCRDVDGKWPSWGWASDRSSQIVARAECLAEPLCSGYAQTWQGQWQFYCQNSAPEGTCTVAGNGGKAVVEGNGSNEGPCYIRNQVGYPIADFSQVNLDGIQASKLTGTTLDDDTIIFRWINDEYFKMVLTDLTGSVLQEGYVSEDSADWRDPSTWENIAGFYRIENFQPAENLDGTQASGVVGIPLDDESNYLHNVVEENAEGVGGWGGSCTCPDGSVYQVGDNYDHCGTLACIGGVSGECHRIHGDWSYQRVTCGVVPPADDKAFVQGPKTGCEFGYVQPATAEECQAVAQANGVKYWGGGGAGHSSAADPRGCIYRTPDRDIYFNTHSTGSTNRGDRRTVCVEVESDFVGNSRRLLDADGGSRAHLRKM